MWGACQHPPSVVTASGPSGTRSEEARGDMEVEMERSRRLGLVVMAMAALVALPACEEEEGSDIVSYTDSAGRSCSVDLADVAEIATCDVDASALFTCEAGQDPEFTTNPDHDFDTGITTLESCGACVDRPAHMSFIVSDTCATIECEVDMDCLYLGYTCGGGRCTRM